MELAVVAIVVIFIMALIAWGILQELYDSERRIKAHISLKLEHFHTEIGHLEDDVDQIRAYYQEKAE